MAKSSESTTFTNSVIEVLDDNSIIITEYAKDETLTYNFTEILKGWEGVDGVAISIKSSKEIPPVDND